MYMIIILSLKLLKIQNIYKNKLPKVIFKNALNSPSPYMHTSNKIVIINSPFEWIKKIYNKH